MVGWASDDNADHDDGVDALYAIIFGGDMELVVQGLTGPPNPSKAAASGRRGEEGPAAAGLAWSGPKIAFGTLSIALYPLILIFYYSYVWYSLYFIIVLLCW